MDSCQAARKRYEKLKSAKKRQEKIDWERFWVGGCDHSNVWKYIRTLAGQSKGGTCLCSMEVQKEHYRTCGEIIENPDFDSEEGNAADAWLQEFMQSERGCLGVGGFTSAQVKAALKRTRECAPGIDGVSRRWVLPLRQSLVPLLVVIFSFIYAHGVTIDAWELAIIASVKKSGPSLTDMSNQRGVHILQFFRQVYTSLLIPELDELSRRVVPDCQQGFVRGGFIGASYLALHSMVERARLREERLYTAFVDVRRAFPSVHRALLLRKLDKQGASDSLLRALASLYKVTTGSVRSSEGLSEIFELHLGTREGGVESPLLYVLFVADLIEFLEEVEPLDGNVLLDGKATPALQFADDLVLIANSERDLNRLLARWGKYCDRSHQATQTKKTVVVVFTSEDDGTLRLDVTTGRIRDGRRRTMVFKYKKTDIAVSDVFDYLGVRSHWREGPGAACRERDLKGTKAMGAVSGTLRWVPHLPFARTVMVGESMVGGAYLYSSDLWAAYVDQRQQGIGPKYLLWLLGFGKARAARTVGWLSIRDLDLKGAAAVVRMLTCSVSGNASLVPDDEKPVNSLLRRAVRQMCENRESTRGWFRSPRFLLCVR